MGDVVAQPGDVGFSLDAPQGGLSAAAFGRCEDLKKQYGREVTDVTVCNWISRGLPAIRSADGAWLIDKAKGLEWVKREIGERGHGGAREGAGKKSGKGKSGRRRERQEADVQDEQQDLALEAAAEKAEGDEVVSFLARVPVSHPDFVAEAFKAGLRKASIDRIVRLLEVQSKTTDLSIRTRGMVSVAAAAERMSDKLVKARAIVQAAPLKVAEATVSAAKLDPSVVPVLCAEIRRELALMMRELASIDAPLPSGRGSDEAGGALSEGVAA